MFLYSALIGVVGLACATAVGWPVMVCAAAILTVGSVVYELSIGASVPHAILTGAGSFVIVEVCYILGGFFLSLRPRRAKDPGVAIGRDPAEVPSTMLRPQAPGRPDSRFE